MPYQTHYFIILKTLKNLYFFTWTAISAVNIGGIYGKYIGLGIKPATKLLGFNDKSTANFRNT